MDTLRTPGILSEHLIDFCRFLRTKGFKLGSREETEALQALTHIPFSSMDDFKLLLKSLLTKTYAQRLNFDQLFQEFWWELFQAFDAKTKKVEKPTSQKSAASLLELKKWLYREPPKPEKTESTPFYSLGKGSSQLLPDYQTHQITELAQVLRRFTEHWASRHSRRFITTSKTHTSLDIRKSLQKNILTGEMIKLFHKKPKLQKLDLVILCDVSRSMELFTKFTVQFLYAFQNNYRSIETLVFGTELYRISSWLKHHSFEKSLEILRQQVPDWSGGTRIGHALDQFIDKYGAQHLNKKTIFLIISDGWDTGDLQLLEWSMAYIQRRVRKLIWLNPQAAKPGYEPQVAGMKTALPYIDIFQGVHDLDSLRQWQQSGYRSLYRNKA